MELMHYGTPRHSGRYPWGSGENPYQHEEYLRKTVSELKAKGFNEKDIREAMGLTTTEYRAMNQISKAAKREEEFRMIRELADKGYSNAEIGKRLDPPRGESSVRAMRDEAFQRRNSIT